MREFFFAQLSVLLWKIQKDFFFDTDLLYCNQILWLCVEIFLAFDFSFVQGRCDDFWGSVGMDFIVMEGR